MAKAFFNKRNTFFVLVLLVMCLLSGCGGQTQKEEADKQEEDKLQIGFSFDSFLIERWERDRDIFVTMAKELGAEVNVQNANGDVEEQIAQIEYLIEKKMDAILIVSVDSDGLSEVVKKAKDAGIIVIAYDRMIYNADVDLYISFDNEAVGELMGEALVQNGITNGKVLVLSGPTTDNNVSMVNEGFTKKMRENGNEIVDTMYADNWRPEYASEYIYSHPEVLDEIDAIMCGNDSIATQAIRVLAEKRKAGEILVTGQDADLEACQRIVEGTQLMTVYKPVEVQARTAVECTIGLIEGNMPEEINAHVSDGTYIVPGIVLDPVSVTAANMDAVIIDSGFHLREDVYLNVGDDGDETAVDGCACMKDICKQISILLRTSFVFCKKMLHIKNLPVHAL